MQEPQEDQQLQLPWITPDRNHGNASDVTTRADRSSFMFSTTSPSRWPLKLLFCSFAYLALLQPQLLFGRLVLMSPAGRRRDTRSQSAPADRCCGRAGSGRDALLTGTPPELSSCGASSDLHTPPPSPARRADAPGGVGEGGAGDVSFSDCLYN